jgi:hypothetical protein
VKVIKFSCCKANEQACTTSNLEELSALHPELIIHSDVSWLSASKALSRVWEHNEEIKGFISSDDH